MQVGYGGRRQASQVTRVSYFHRGGEALKGINPSSGAIDTTSIPAAPGEGCPRCGGKVFSAEEMLSRNKVTTSSHRLEVLHLTPSLNSSFGKLLQFYFPSVQDKDVSVESIASSVPVLGLLAVGRMNAYKHPKKTLICKGNLTLIAIIM